MPPPGLEKALTQPHTQSSINYGTSFVQIHIITRCFPAVFEEKCIQDGWTEWMDSSTPTYNSGGDPETHDSLRRSYTYCSYNEASQTVIQLTIQQCLTHDYTKHTMISIVHTLHGMRWIISKARDQCSLYSVLILTKYLAIAHCKVLLPV